MRGREGATRIAELVQKAVRDPRAVVLVGIILAYVWRFHILVPTVEVFRFSAILTLSSWAFLFLSPNMGRLSAALRVPFIWLYFLLLMWALLGHLFGLDPARSLEVLQDVHLRNALFLLFLLSTMTSFARLEMALAANALGAAVLAFFYIKQGTPTLWTPVRTYDRNDLALLFNMSLPIVLWFLGLQKTTRAKFGFGLAAAALGFCVVMSQSRGGFLGLAAILLYLIFTERGVPLRYRLAPVFAFAAGLMLLPAEVSDRLRTLTSLESDYNVESATGRMEIWKRGMEYTRDHPIFGLGLTNFPIAEATLSDEARQFGGRWKASVAHNSYMEILAETGIPGGMLYVGMIGAMFVLVFHRRGQLRRWRREGGERAVALFRLGNALSASILGFAFGSFFLTTFSLSLLVVLLALSAGFVTNADRAMAGWRRGGVPRRRRRKVRRAPVHTERPLVLQ